MARMEFVMSGVGVGMRVKRGVPPGGGVSEESPGRREVRRSDAVLGGKVVS